MVKLQLLPLNVNTKEPVLIRRALPRAPSHRIELDIMDAFVNDNFHEWHKVGLIRRVSAYPREDNLPILFLLLIPRAVCSF